jgi:Tfp pilus assembly protein PilV
MSAAPNYVQTIIGNTARALPWNAPAEEAGAGRRLRTPLSLVPSIPRKRRSPLVVFTIGILVVAALMTVLVLNVQLSSGQYELVQLKAKQAELVKANQDLAAQDQNAAAPQNLAARALGMGMVTSSNTGQINADTKVITGNPLPAAAAADKQAVIPAPAVNAGDHSAAAPAATVPGGPAKAGTDPTATDPAAAASPAAGAPAAVAPQPAPASELNGGTIPAPAQKDS